MAKLIDTHKCLLMEVPEDIIKFKVWQPFKIGGKGKQWPGGLGFERKSTGDEWYEIDFPDVAISYGQPILASEMTTVQKMEYVKTGIAHGERWYHDYEFSTKRLNLSYGTADESFASLLRSHNLQPETTVVIPKK